MSDFEQRLPERYSFGAKGGPVFSTEVNKTVGGQAFANRNWTYPLHRYDITEGVKKPSDFAQILAFFYNVYGRSDAFRFKWWPDYQANGDSLSLVSGSVFQLQRDYAIGTRIFHRPINKPVVGKVAVTRMRGGVPSAITTSIDYTTGLVTVTGHVAGDTYSWVGEFDVRVAFVNDALEMEVVNRNGTGLLTQWPSIQLEERRL